MAASLLGLDIDVWNCIFTWHDQASSCRKPYHLYIEIIKYISLTFFHDGGKECIFAWSVKAHKVHAPVTAEVSSIKPIPVLKLMPRFTPW